MSAFFRTLVFLVLAILPSLAAEPPTQRVGLPLVIEDQYLPGPLLEPVPRRDREPSLVVRILETKPAKDGFRYTFEIEGLDPGTHDLGEYLRETIAESGHSAHKVPVLITTELPPGLPKPAELEPKPLPKIGGYRALLWGLGIFWSLVLIAIISSFRKKKAATVSQTPPPTLAERLKPLLEKAAVDSLTTDEKARLERLLVAHWRDRLPELAGLTPEKTLRRLRSHPEASPLILRLEAWLHAPDPKFDPAELDALLSPYRTTNSPALRT